MANLKAIIRINSEYKKHSEYWTQLYKMYKGGNELDLQTRIALLDQPPSRSMDAQARMAKGTYINKVGPEISKQATQLFQNNPSIQGYESEYWDTFLAEKSIVAEENTDFYDFLRNSFIYSIVQGVAYCQVDTAIGEGNLAEQRANGALNPYTILLKRENLVDLKIKNGQFEFAKIHRYYLDINGWDSEPMPTHDYTIYYKRNQEVLSSRYLITPKKPKDYVTTPFVLTDLTDDVEIKTPLVNGKPLEDMPIFNMNGKYRFPIVFLNTYWLADQLYDLQRTYFKLTAGCDWDMLNNLFSMMYVTTPEEKHKPVEMKPTDPLFDQLIGDGYYLRFPDGTKFGSISNGGRTTEVASSYMDSIIDKNIANIASRIGEKVGISLLPQSLPSKREDNRPTTLLMLWSALKIKGYARKILDVCAIAHNEEIDWQITGMEDFQEEGLIEYLEDYKSLTELGIGNLSSMFTEEMAVNIAKKYAEIYEVNSNTLESIVKDIRAKKGKVPEKPEL
ncbi:MAG: hypothetical protein ACRC78_03025 [Planktothrix sp.]